MSDTDEQLKDLRIRVEALELRLTRRGSGRINGPTKPQADRRREYLAEVGRDEPAGSVFSEAPKIHPRKKPRPW